MSAFEKDEIIESIAGLSLRDSYSHLGALLDMIWNARRSFAIAAVMTQDDLALKSLPKSRRPFIDKQAGLFAALARGEWKDVFFERDQNTFRGIRQYWDSRDGEPAVPTPTGTPDAADAVKHAIVEATLELRSLRSLAAYESGVTEAHGFTKVPKRFEKTIEIVTQMLMNFARNPGEYVIPNGINPKECLERVGASETLTTSQYIEAVVGA